MRIPLVLSQKPLEVSLKNYHCLQARRKSIFKAALFFEVEIPIEYPALRYPEGKHEIPGPGEPKDLSTWNSRSKAHKQGKGRKGRNEHHRCSPTLVVALTSISFDSPTIRCTFLQLHLSRGSQQSLDLVERRDGGVGDLELHGCTGPRFGLMQLLAIHLFQTVHSPACV